MRCFSCALLASLGMILAVRAEETPGANAPGSPAPGANAPGSPAPGANAPGSPAPGANAPGSPAAELSVEIAFNEKLLREAGQIPDGPGLVAFFRSRVLSEADQHRLKLAVVRLGDDAYEVREKASRELTRAGRFALPLLRGPR